MPRYKRGSHQRWTKRRPHYKKSRKDTESSSESDDQSVSARTIEMVDETITFGNANFNARYAPPPEEVPIAEEVAEPIVESELVSPPPKSKLRQSQIIGGWLPAPPGYEPPEVPKKPKKAKAPKFALGDTVRIPPPPRPSTPPTPGLGIVELTPVEEDELPDEADTRLLAATTAMNGHFASFSNRFL